MNHSRGQFKSPGAAIGGRPRAYVFGYYYYYALATGTVSLHGARKA